MVSVPGLPDQPETVVVLVFDDPEKAQVFKKAVEIGDVAFNTEPDHGPTHLECLGYLSTKDEQFENGGYSAQVDIYTFNEYKEDPRWPES